MTSEKEDKRNLIDLVSVGKATVGDFRLLGIDTVEQLKSEKPEELYSRLCEVTGIAHDICCLDVFEAAVAQAKDPQLPREQCDWWYWSQERKKRKGKT